MKKHIVFVIIVALCGFGCTRLKQGGNGKCEGNSLGDYLFDLPVTITPAQDTFHIGDTLWLEQDFSESMVNLKNGKTYVVENFDFMSEFRLYNIALDPHSNSGAWDAVAEIGSMEEVPTAFGKDGKLNYVYEYGRYRLKAAIILRATGVFSTYFRSDIRFGKLSDYGQHVTDCRPEYMEISYAVNNKSANGYSLYQAAPDSQISSRSKGDYDYSGSFSFVVLP